MLIVNIVGKKSSGKSTAAKFLVENFGFVRLSFARHLKETVKLLFGFSEEQVNGNLKEVIDDRYGICPREALQFMGDVMRENACDRFPGYKEKIGRYFWVNCLIADIEKARNEKAIGITVDDCRYAVEYQAIKKYAEQNKESVQAKTIRIIGNQDIIKQLTSLETHSSETELDTIPFDVKIDNTNLLMEELYATIIKSVFN